MSVGFCLEVLVPEARSEQFVLPLQKCTHNVPYDSIAIAGNGFPAFNVARLGCSVSVVDSGILSSDLFLLMYDRLGSNYSVGSWLVYRRVFGEYASVVDDFPCIDLCE